MRAAVLAAVLTGVLLAALWLRKPAAPIPPTTELTITPLASLRGTERHPSVSSDGTRVAFAYTEDKEADTHIFIRNLSDARITRLTSGDLPALRATRRKRLQSAQGFPRLGVRRRFVRVTAGQSSNERRCLKDSGAAVSGCWR